MLFSLQRVDDGRSRNPRSPRLKKGLPVEESIRWMRALTSSPPTPLGQEWGIRFDTGKRASLISVSRVGEVDGGLKAWLNSRV